jgi:hypothetical protein
MWLEQGFIRPHMVTLYGWRYKGECQMTRAARERALSLEAALCDCMGDVKEEEC